MMRPLLLLALVAAAFTANGQQSIDSLSLDHNPALSLQDIYYQDKISLTKLYNGPEYIDYTKLYSAINGHQFFLSPEKKNGSVTYDNHAFHNVKMAYDIAREQVVVQHANNPFTLKLLSKNVQEFTIEGHRFTRLISDSTTKSVIQTGFYELLVDDKLKVYAHRKKGILERIEQSNITLDFIPNDKFYLSKDNAFYYIKNKGHLIELLGSREKELREYIKAKRLKFKKNRKESDIMSTVQYFQSLSR